MNRFENVKPGDETFCVEYDGEDYFVCLFMAACGNYVIATPMYSHCIDDFESQLEEMSMESEDRDGVDVYLLPENRVWLTKDEVMAHISQEETS